MNAKTTLEALTSPGVLWMLCMLGLGIWKVCQPRAKEPAKIFLLIMLFALEPLTKTVMDAENRAFPLKYDYYLYLIDRGLGISAFWVARLFSEWQRTVLFIIYQSLSAMMIAWYAINLKNRDGQPRAVLVSYLATFMVGPLLYLVVPACGPRHAFGAAFPMGDPGVPVALIRLSYWPNAIPSLHVTTALLFVLFAGGRRILRAIAWFYLTGTILATLAFEHYMIDLVVAVPFACFSTLLARREVGRAAANLAAVLVWLLAIRFCPSELIEYPTLLKVLTITTVGIAGLRMAKPRQLSTVEVERPVAMEVSA